MSILERWTDRRTRLMNRFHARRAARAAAATGFQSNPEPRTVGSFARGRQLAAGNLMFAGHLIEAPKTMLWDIIPPDLAFEEETHSFAWLDDMAAVTELHTRKAAQEWVWGWIERYGDGSGPGWLPELTGRRMIRLVHHALMLLRGRNAEQTEQFYRALAAHAHFLSRRWHATPACLPRIEALTGLLYAGLSLQGMDRFVEPARKALAQECAREIDADGGIVTRNPEELLEVFTLLTWVAAALEEAGKSVDDDLRNAIQRVAPILRALRHSDGGLARFHGGGRGIEGRLEQALAASGVRKRKSDGLAMGFARLSAGRTSLIVDAAPPPVKEASYNAHASTLAFELTSGRRPLIVNCGSGAVFGEEWRRAGRATPSHSTLCLDGYSSARLGKQSNVRGATREMLEDAPKTTPTQLSLASDGVRFEGGHDGYVSTHGLTHARILEMTSDGRGVAGEDMLLAMDASDKATFDTRMNATLLEGIPFQIRFHLHPEVDAELDLGGTAVSMVLKSGEIWVFRHDSKTELTIEPSVYLEKGRLRPRGAQQIVLSGRAMEYATSIRWSLAKAHDTAIAIRDVGEVEAEEPI